MLKVTMPSSSASSAAAGRAGGAAPDYWIDGSNKDTLAHYFELESELGRGATSIVYRCRQKGTQKPYAVKMLKKTVDKKIVRTEIGVLLRLSHPNIIKLKEIFETPTEISLVLELVTGGELFDRIVEKGYYSERDAADAVKQILEAVADRKRAPARPQLSRRALRDPRSRAAPQPRNDRPRGGQDGGPRAYYRRRRRTPSCWLSFAGSWRCRSSTSSCRSGHWPGARRHGGPICRHSTSWLITWPPMLRRPSHHLPCPLLQPHHQLLQPSPGRPPSPHHPPARATAPRDPWSHLRLAGADTFLCSLLPPSRGPDCRHGGAPGRARPVLGSRGEGPGTWPPPCCI
ncbi:calcium/calmodulin-dependent protein kinase type IV isoform X3 [Carettochelys insculpta]|uniref:calcium/calmodulin-dependent protein kinase type IV isoform X3 n=1 Tax=Carettochelys insculpta TaxID=44489 RepID=UPI003EBE4DF2